MPQLRKSRDDGETSHAPGIGTTVVLRVKGDLTIPTARSFYRRLKAVAARREVKAVIVDFSETGRLDSSGVAVMSLATRMMARRGKRFDTRALSDRHQAALELLRRGRDERAPAPEHVGIFERAGDRMVMAAGKARDFWGLVADTGREAWAVLTRRKRLPEGALFHQAVTIGVDGIFIVGLLSFLLGMTMAFQGSVQLRQFGAGVFVADLVSVSMVREFGPMMTAIILTGRTGAAIAAELGTMRVRAEVDALRAMGVSPVRFLVLPRILALSIMQPALALIAMFIGIGGGMLVTAMSMDMSILTFWGRTTDAVVLGDFVHGVGKSLVFAWIIGFTGSYMGLGAGGDASSVGTSTTKTVVVCIFLVIVVDAAFATITTLTASGGA